MPQTITLYRIFLAAPSDVTEELSVVGEILEDWNLQHGQELGVRVEMVNWRTHTFPATGKRPQALVNKQAFDACDVVVALFWSRFGTPTGRANSGTEEEIRRGIRQGKKVLVYFSDRPIPQREKRKDDVQIDQFKRRFGQKAIYWVYSDLQRFEKAFRGHIANTMHDLIKERTTSAT